PGEGCAPFPRGLCSLKPLDFLSASNASSDALSSSTTTTRWPRTASWRDLRRMSRERTLTTQLSAPLHRHFRISGCDTLPDTSVMMTILTFRAAEKLLLR